MKLDDISTAIAAIDADPALCSALKAQLKIAAPNFLALLSLPEPKPLRPFPDPASITAAQCSVFDNWIEHGGGRPKRGSRGHYKDRFKLTLDVWTCDPDKSKITKRNAHFTGMAHLLTGTELQQRTRTHGTHILPKSLDAEYRHVLVSYSTQLGNGRLGPIYSRGDGTRFIDHTFALTDANLATHSVETVLVSSPAGSFLFEGFKPLTAKGNTLSGNCFAHARMTTSKGLAKAWDATLVE